MSTASFPLITVITPAYNVGPYIGEAVDSVLNQSFKDFEYLVVDDGSDDDTVEQVEQRTAKDSRIRLIRADHGGAANARNLAIKEAHGKYIAFLDGDDRWSHDFLEKELSLLQTLGNDVAAVFCRARVMTETGRVYYRHWQKAGRYDFDDMLIQSCPPRVGSSLLIKKEAFDRAGLFDTDVKSTQDLDMWLRIQRDSGMPYFWGDSHYLVDIRKRPGAISRDHTKRFKALEDMTSEYASDMKRNPVGMAYVRAAVFAYRAGADDYAERFSTLAKQAGWLRLIKDGYGRRVLAWSALNEKQRDAVHTYNGKFRGLVGRVIGAAGGLKR